MAQLRIVRTTHTSNPVGSPVIRRTSGGRFDLLSSLTDRLRHAVAQVRLVAGRQ